MNIFKRFALLFATLITILVGLPTTSYIAVSADETDSNITINQTIEQDLETFDFDYTRYFLSESEYLHPVVVNFRESKSTDYYDLLYVYGRKEKVNIKECMIGFDSVSYSLYVGDTYDDAMSESDCVYLNVIKDVIHQDFIYIEETDGYLFRLALRSSYRASFNCRYYKFNELNYYIEKTPRLQEDVTLEIDNYYLFDNSLSFIYSNCVNVILEDAHCWSWHFDEDSGWENFWEWWSGNKSDLLNDQLFYSFYVKNWNIKELKSIDLKYKKALLEGYRYNEADVGNTKEFYQGYTGTSVDPKYYLWNENNSSEYFDKSIFLGNSIQEISDSINYNFKTIDANDVNNISTSSKEYKWNSILNIVEFQNIFGHDSNISKFASNFFTEDFENYWIINFDEYYYYYLKTQVSYYSSVKGSYFHPEDVYDHSLEMSDFINYCESHGLSSQVIGSSGDWGSEWTSKYYEVYHFNQEYVFDMSATKMTFEDYSGAEYELPTSVAPVNQEGSGGTSIRPSDNAFDLLKLIALLFGIGILIVLLPLLITFVKLLVNIIILPFKWIIKLFKNRGQK